MKHKAIKPAGSAIVMYRPFFTVDKVEDVEGEDFKLVTLAPFTDKVFADLAAYWAAVEGGAAAVKEGVEAAKEAADKAKEGEDKGEGDGEKAEGEGM